MDKALLINPRFSEFTGNPLGPVDSISFGLLCLGSYIQNQGIKVKLIDCLTSVDYRENIKKNISSSTIVGISAMTSQLPEAIEFSKIAKEVDESIPVVWGGCHPTLFPKETLEAEYIDYIVIDEGEETFKELIDSVEGRKEKDKVLGLAYSQGDKVKINLRRPFLDINSLPHLDWKLIEKDVRARLEPAPTHTSRGCPYSCTFCINRILNSSWRSANPEYIFEELFILQTYFKGKRIRFWDENFFVNKKRAEEIIDGIIERKLDIQWETTIRADYFRQGFVDDKLLAKIQKSGCYKLSFGAESGSPRILEMLEKGITPEQTLYSAKQCGKYEIQPEYSFMIGMPNETVEDMKMTIQLLYDLKKVNKDAKFLGPQPFRPYPGSPLFDECVRQGWKSPQGLEEWAKMMGKEWGYLSPKDFPWVQDPDYVEAIWPILHYALTDTKTALETGVKTNKLFKMMFIIAAKARWKLHFFEYPIEYKIARKVLDALNT